MNELTFVMIALFIVFLFLKIPVFISLLASGLVYFILTPGISPVLFAQRGVAGIESIPLLAIPFFICAGAFMNYSGITRRLMDFCGMVTGRMRGGLAQVNVLLSLLMGGMVGSSLADVSMQSKLLVPEMEKRGYSRQFSTVLTAATGTIITPLIPPGITMILYGSIGNVSIGRLFVSGLGLGIFFGICFMILVAVISRIRNYKPFRTEKIPRDRIIPLVRPAILPLCIPIFIIGALRFGICTATEAGAIMVVFSVLLGVFYKELNTENFLKAIKETVVTTSAVMLIIAAASVFSWILTRERIPHMLTELMFNVTDNKYVFLIVINIFLLVIGMFLEGNSASIILIPLLAPVAASYGVNEIHFAMIYIFNISIGGITPPLGTVMFVACTITKCKTKEFLREALPFYGILVIMLFFVTFVPALSLTLVNLVF